MSSPRSLMHKPRSSRTPGTQLKLWRNKWQFSRQIRTEPTSRWKLDWRQSGLMFRVWTRVVSEHQQKEMTVVFSYIHIFLSNFIILWKATDTGGPHSLYICFFFMHNLTMQQFFFTEVAFHAVLTSYHSINHDSDQNVEFDHVLLNSGNGWVDQW